MFVIGQTNLLKTCLYYDENGDPWPADQPVEGAAGVVEWYTRPMRSADRHLFEGDTKSEDADRDVVLALTDHIVGLAVLAGDEKVPIETLTTENCELVDGWMTGRVLTDILKRMEATAKAVGESATPSDS